MKTQILIIDDNPGSSELMRAILEAEGYTVSAAEEEKVAVEMAKGKQPDLIIIDTSEPLKTCQTVRKDAQLKDIPIMILTATPLEPQEKKEMQKLGVVDYLLRSDVLLEDPSGQLFIKRVKTLLPERPQPGIKNLPQEILVIDDDPGSRLLLRTKLQAENFRVIEASDGQQGLAKLQQHLPALVLLDIQMPKISGIEVLEKIKASYPDTAVVMITAYGTEEIAVEAMRKGADDYISKPIDFRKLTTTVKNAIQNRQLKLAQKRLSKQLRQTSIQLMKKVDELKKTNQSLIETRDRLVKAEKLAAITQTAITVNHQINNPLTVILGNAQLLLAQCEQGEGKSLKKERLIKGLRAIETQCLRIRNVVHKLATLAEPVLTEYAQGEKMLDI